jgi:hypothetical protein
MRVSRSWQDTLAFDPGVASRRPGVASRYDRYDFFHPERAVARGGEGLGVATLNDWEQNTVAVNRIRLGLFDDRVRLTTRYGRSRHDGDNSYLASLEGAGPERDRDGFLGRNAATGQAFSQRLDVSLWRSGRARLGAFESYRRVDPRFEWKEAAKEDPFGTSDRRAVEAGGTIGMGMLELTLSRISEEAKIDDFRVDDRPSQRSYRAVLTASRDVPAPPDLPLSRFLPDAAWISVMRGDVDHGDSPGGAATRDLSFGASWNGETSSAMLSFWESSYKSAALDLYWFGSGADLEYGIYRKPWDLYAGLGVQRNRSDQADDTWLESSIGGYLSFSVRPEMLPDFTTTLNLNRYEADYSTLAEGLRTDTWGFQTVLDFSKYLGPARFGPHFRTYYRADWSKTRNGFADPDVVFDQAVMASFEVDF